MRHAVRISSMTKQAQATQGDQQPSDTAAQAGGEGARARRPDIFARESLGWRAAFAVATSVLIPLIIDLVRQTPLWAKLVVGLAWFTALATAEVAILVNRQYRMRTRETSLWDTYDRLDAVLSSMRKSLRTIEGFESSPEALFRSHFSQEVSNLEAELRHSAESRTLAVSRNHLRRAALVLREFDGREEDCVLAVFQAGDISAELSDHLVQEWFSRVYSQTQMGAIRNVKRLILLDSVDEERSPLVQLLIDFHITNSDRFECKLMPTELFCQTVEDYSPQVHLEANDFAVYRGKYVFFGRPLAVGKRTGVWSNAPETVELMTAIFNGCWNHPRTRPCVSSDTPRTPVTPEELFAAASGAYRHDEGDVIPHRPTSVSGSERSGRDASPIGAKEQSEMSVRANDRVRVFVIGLSDYLRRFALPGLAKARGIQLVGLAVRDVGSARDRLGDFQIGDIVAPYEVALSRNDVDAIYVCLPNALHLEWVLRALDSGKHVLCEKPMVLRAGDVDLIEERAKTAGLCVMEGLMYRFHPQWSALQDTLASGGLGATRVVISDYAYLDTAYEGPRFSPDLGGGVLRMVGGYPVNVALVAFQEVPVAVTASQRPAGDTGVDATTSAILEFPSGHAIVSASVDAFDNQYARIVGSGGMVELLTPFNPSSDQRVELRFTDSTGQDSKTFDPADQFQLEFEHFSEVVRGVREPAVTLEESRLQAMVLGAIASSFTRGGERIELSG